MAVPLPFFLCCLSPFVLYLALSSISFFLRFFLSRFLRFSFKAEEFISVLLRVNFIQHCGEFHMENLDWITIGHSCFPLSLLTRWHNTRVVSMTSLNNQRICWKHIVFSHTEHFVFKSFRQSKNYVEKFPIPDVTSPECLARTYNSRL
jgi:hypothetical protein